MDDPSKAADSEFSAPSSDTRERLARALEQVSGGAPAGPLLEALSEAAERDGKVEELGRAYADLLAQPHASWANLPATTRLELNLQAAWACAQDDTLHPFTLRAASAALDVAPADERALALAEPLLLEREEYDELANRYAIAATSADSEERARKLLERAIHMLADIAAAAPAVQRLNEGLQRLALQRDSEEALLSLARTGDPAPRQAAVVRLGERWLAEGRAREGLELLEVQLSSIDDDAALDVIERLCDQAEDRERLEQTLLRRLELEPGTLGRARALEKLGRFHHEWGADGARAAEVLQAAAQSFVEAGEADDAQRCYERLLDLQPAHASAAATLVALRAKTGDFTGVAEAFGTLLRASEDNRRATELLLSISAEAERAGAAEEFGELVDTVLWRLSGEERELSARLLRESARLFGHCTRYDEAAELYRRLIADQPSSQDLDAYQALIDSNPASEWRRSQQRWLFEWQEHHSSDRPSVLLSWARFEEQDLGDPDAAMAVLTRAAELAPDRAEIWEHLARLHLAEGDAGAGLQAASQLRRLGRDVDSSLLELLLEQEPATRWALDRVKLTLCAEERWPELFRLYDRAIEATSSAAERAELLDEAAIAARDVARDRTRAIRYWQRYVELLPADARVDLALERLYEQAGDARGSIAHLMRRRCNLSGEARLGVERRIAELSLQVGELEQALEAIECLPAEADESVRLLEATFQRGLALGAASERSDVMRRIALLLRQRHAEAGRPEQVADVVRRELRLPLEEKARRELLQELARLCEKELGDADAAFEVERELFTLTRGERERKRLEKLAKKLDRFADLREAYVKVAHEHSDATGQRELLARAAELSRVRLKQPEQAQELYRRLLELEPSVATQTFESLELERDARRIALAALCELLREAGRFAELAEVLAREAAHTGSNELLLELARVQAEHLGDAVAAIQGYLKGGDSRAAAAVFLRAGSVYVQDPEPALELARCLRASGQNGEALQVLRHQLASYASRYPEERKRVQLQLIEVLRASGDEAAARSELSEAAKHYPTDAEVQRTCAAAATARKDWDKAEQCYRTLLLLLLGSGAKSTHLCRASVYVELAHIQEQRQQASEASELLESAFEAALDSPRELSALAQSLLEHQKWPEAERAVSALLQLSQDLPSAAHALAGAACVQQAGHELSDEVRQASCRRAEEAASRWHELDDPAQASSLLSACICLLPLEPARRLLLETEAHLLPLDAARAGLSLSRRQLQSEDEALRGEGAERLARIVELREAPLEAWSLLLREAITDEDVEQALRAYDALSQAGVPLDSDLSSKLGRLCARVGRWDQAAGLLRGEVERERHPTKRAALLVEVAELFRSAGRAEQARELGNEARSLDPACAESVLLLAHLELDQGRRELALSLLTEHAEAKERRRGKPLSRVLRLAADLRLERDELAEALALLIEAHQLDKSDLDTALLLGLLAVDLDRLETAASALRVLIAQRELGTREGAAARALNLAQGYFQLARIEHHHGKKTNAKRMALRALEENPRLLPAQRLLSELGHA